ncbi:unnamed protein product [Blepharisma stoltei]|uniref:C2 domain-containing protein n=1 Tax=Blepharisma stoltei TaxID=1481888 RepID=A0AAU9KCQ5_9CILI|nr:unnamed protein product [Blepharisma stoltei]
MSSIKKEYLCQVTIIEARDLAGINSEGSCDPFIRVTCGNAGSQATTANEDNTNPCWNQSFTFSKLMLTDMELETWELKIECLNHNQFLKNSLVGSFSFGLATLHRNSNHEFYGMWITLLHPDHGSSPRGYVLMNCFIVGPQDIPPAHAIGEHMGLEEDADESDDDMMDELLTPEQRKLKKLKAQSVKIVGAPMIARKSYQLSVNIYKAEHFGNHPNAFVSARTCGFVDKTHTMKETNDPIWNVKLSFPAYKPILNDRITVRVWDQRPLARDIMIATIPEIPSDHDFFNITNLLSRGGVMPCRWIPLYGQNLEESSIWDGVKEMVGSKKKSYIGTCYKGRLLLSLTVSPNDDPETGASRAAPYREPIAKIHSLRVILFELKNAKNCGDTVRIRISMGPFNVWSKKTGKRETTDSNTNETIEYFQWGSAYSGEQIAEIKEPFPIDPSQAPDVFLDLYSEGLLGGEKRIGYIRKPASEIIGRDYPFWLPFRSLDTHSEVGSDSPGLVLVSMSYQVDEGSGQKSGVVKSKPRKADRWLCWNVYGGLDMAPSLEDEDTNLALKIYCGDSVINLPDEISEQCAHTKYPIWKWSGVKPLQLHEDLHFEQNLRLEVYNKSTIMKWFDSTDEIGQFSVPLYVCENQWSQPHFFHVINAREQGVSQGRVLAEFFIAKSSIDSSNNPCKRESEATMKCDIEFAIIGIRNLVPKYEKPEITVTIPGYTMEKDVKAEISVSEVKNKDRSNPNFLTIIKFKNVTLPVTPIYLPALYIKLKDTAFLSWNECYTFIPLMPYAHWITDEAIKREALELYNRNFTVKELIEQVPLRSVPQEKLRRTGDESYTDYAEDCIPDDSANEEDNNTQGKELDMSDIFDPKNSRLTKKIQFDKVEVDEEIEIRLREDKEKELNSELEILRAQAKKQTEKKGEVKETLKLEIRKKERELDVVKEGVMTEKRFMKKDEVLDEDGFQYNRPIYKQGPYEEALELPYERYFLFRKTKNTEKLSAFRVGEPTGAILKSSVYIRILEDGKPYDPNTSFPDPDTFTNDFNFFHPGFRGTETLMSIFGENNFDVRVYILRGLSLSAVDNAPDWIAFSGGLDALSSANSYPQLIIGDHKDVDGKYVNDTKPELKNLNPEFFRSYEMEAEIPSDWKLQISIFNLNEYGFDNIIGSTIIDLEDRYFGDPYTSKKLMMKELKNHCDREIEETQEPKLREWLVKIRKNVKRDAARLDVSQHVAPVEYRALENRGKKTAQGMIELFLEVLDSQEAKLIPVSKIAKPIPEEYELRFIVYKCEGIPRRPDKEVTDIFFRVAFDCAGWIEESVQKETDAHMGSSDGHGVFNWRMKFHFQLPCTFARLRVNAYDFSTFGDDQVVSEVILDLSRYFSRVLKEGKLSVEESWTDLHLPNKPGTNGGKLMFSFYILSLAEANQRPVGEAQDEPNRDPELETPEEGRGVSDFLKGTAFDVSGWSLWDFGILKKILAVLSLGGMAIVLFIYPGFLTGGAK